MNESDVTLGPIEVGQITSAIVIQERRSDPRSPIGWRIQAWEAGFRQGITRSSHIKYLYRTQAERRLFIQGFNVGLTKPPKYEQVEMALGGNGQ